MLQSPLSIIPISSTEGSWIVSVITLSACAGAIPTGVIANAVGPKRTLQIMAIPLLVSWYLIAFSKYLWVIYLARLLAGVGVGSTCVAAPMYVTDIAEVRVRGLLGTFFQLQITIGFLIGYTFGVLIESFQILALVSSVFPIIFLVAFYFMPESPTFLLSKNRIHEARMALQFLRGHGHEIENELSTRKEELNEIASNQCKFSDLYRCQATMKAMIIALGLMFFQQFSGINAILFYAGTIFKDASGSLSSGCCTVIIGTVQVLATLMAATLIERLGRKILLLISGWIMAVCLITIGVYFHLAILDYDVTSFAFVPLVCTAVYIVAFSVGFGPIPWMIAGDIFSTKVKGLACSISTTFNWTLAFTVTKLFIPLRDEIGIGFTFIIFGVVCVLAFLFTLTYIPETKGKSLGEVQILLAGGKGIQQHLVTQKASFKV
ncbi:facilitated trehalose transporter Tret1-like isoform X2 [Photinus pyralis]|nr:facilitated trehalose transporter Tret1-like isoform X2 [Photinus pyralis]